MPRLSYDYDVIFAWMVREGASQRAAADHFEMPYGTIRQACYRERRSSPNRLAAYQRGRVQPEYQPGGAVAGAAAQASATVTVDVRREAPTDYEFPAGIEETPVTRDALQKAARRHVHFLGSPDAVRHPRMAEVSARALKTLISSMPELLALEEGQGGTRSRDTAARLARAAAAAERAGWGDDEEEDAA